MDPSKTERKSTAVSGILLIILCLALVAASAAIAMNPDLLENVTAMIIFGVLAIAAVFVIIAVFAGLIAIPMYMKKGVVTQTDMSYDLDDVKEVDGAMEKKE